MSKSGLEVRGIMTWHSAFDRDDIMRAIFSECSTLAMSTGHAWDPFNIKLAVKAHNEPKPQLYKCPICGSTEEAHLCD